MCILSCVCIYLYDHMWLFIHLPLHTTPSSITLKRPTHRSGELSAALFYNYQSMCQVLTLKIHAVGHHFHARNCRGCGQTSRPSRKNKNRKIFFLACLLVICENFPLYGILPEYVSSAHCISIAQPPTLQTVKGIILIMLIERSLQAHELTEYPARVPCKYPVPYKHIMSSQHVWWVYN